MTLSFFTLFFGSGCGSLDGTASSGSGAGNVSVEVKAPPTDEGGGASKSLILNSGFSQSKASSSSSVQFTECTVTATGPTTASQTVSVPTGATSVSLSLDLPESSGYSVCAECWDGDKAVNSVNVGIQGCNESVSISSSNSSVSVQSLFHNLATRSSGDAKYCRVRQDTSQQAQLVCGFNGALTSAEKDTAICNVEIDSEGTRASPGVVSAATSDGFVAGSKAGPYLVMGPGSTKAKCFEYDASGNKLLRMDSSWDTDDDGNTVLKCNIGVRQMRQMFGSRSGRFAAVCSKTGGSPWYAIPISGLAKFDVTGGGDGDVSALLADGASCDTNRNGETCESGLCVSGACVDLSTGGNAALSGLSTSTGSFNSSFSGSTTSYTMSMGFLMGSLQFTPTASVSGAAIKINNSSATSGSATDSYSLSNGDNTFTITVTAPDGMTTKTYTITTTRGAIGAFAQQAYTKASNTEANDRFGQSVAISGNTMVVGAYLEDSNATGVNGDQTDNSAGGSGAAYVFTRSGTTWTQQAYLKGSNAAAGDQFGFSVAISGDTVVVGADFEDSNATGIDGDQTDNSSADSGAAYVFTRSGTTWSQQAYLKASNTGAGDYFGNSVAILGDTIVVGARMEDGSATGINGISNNSAANSGAAYVFTRTGTTWSQQAYVKTSYTEAGDQFGSKVAISGNTIVVGTSSEDSNATGVNGDQTDNSANASGAAYVFTRSGTTWTQQAYLKASNTGANDLFGGSVAINGDTVIIGAAGEDSNATGVDGDETDNSASASGAAYVFTRSGTTWTQQAYLKASNTGASDNFGAVVIFGDTLVVTAQNEDSNATGIGGNQSDNSAEDSGAAYVFTRSGTTWTQQTYLKASNTEASDWFGRVAINGDTIIMGAFVEDSNASGIGGDETDNSAGGSGAVYVFQ
ncbi:MAG: cadherin-like beta sandwich domain-containing protein [Deltaproteobacteria bacterium]|nr:cadherin-like beta sandwich domain-containing protein [Deltaproteobacteria bacterium]